MARTWARLCTRRGQSHSSIPSPQAAKATGYSLSVGQWADRGWPLPACQAVCGDLLVGYSMKGEGGTDSSADWMDTLCEKPTEWIKPKNKSLTIKIKNERKREGESKSHYKWNTLTLFPFYKHIFFNRKNTQRREDKATWLHPTCWYLLDWLCKDQVEARQRHTVPLSLSRGQIVK